MMESLILTLLVCVLMQCHGYTHFHYLNEGQEVTLSCETCKWEADVDADNKVDCILSNNSYNSKKPKCRAGKEDLCKEISKSSSSSCQIVVNHGFYACVNASDSCFIHPFKPSAHHVESFIAAQAKPDMVTDPVMKSLVHVSEEGSINLTCTFTKKSEYSSQPFVVYWIKTSAERSTCVYSYHLTSDGSGFDEHCTIDEHLQLRRSNSSRVSLQETNIHNLTIINATHSDSGQYLCVLHVTRNTQQFWTIITNTTVTLNNPVTPGTTRGKPITTQDANTGATDFHPIYLTGVLVPLLLLCPAIIIMLKRRSAGTKEPQTIIRERFQDEEGVNDDDDSSPYAVSHREEEPAYSLVQLTKEKTDPEASGDGRFTSDPSAARVIMKENSIYESLSP